MIKEFSIENFKSFKQKQKMRMAPITLIYGPNSSGKSSIIQSLISIKHTTENNSPIGSLKTSGSHIELGGFPSVVHKHDVDSDISFGIKYTRNTHIEQSPDEGFILGRKQDRHVDRGKQDIHLLG
ncbi:AAA family ATPase [Aeromonas sp. RU39B]|uniref:AAA family ATPase n=1 Tax=Aeromonas sp. RU39B TaxID=1907416 RepID=UPI0009708C00|nr:AAA family ATPase [Aeromonas sp. RU39B]